MNGLNLDGIHESFWKEVTVVLDRIRAAGRLSDEAVERVLAAYRAATKLQGLDA
jgi:hypothetical protein